MSYPEPLLERDPVGDFVSLPAVEYPDWGYARNKRCVLMSPSAEWVQSVYSCQFELNGKHFIAPNRDYPYEGLLVYQDGENWKFIDCVALALQRQDGSPIPLALDPASPTVRINPWKATYCYKILDVNSETGEQSETPFFVSYYLNSKNMPKLVTGCVELYFPQGLTCGSGAIIPIIQPFLDIRHMYRATNFQDYRVWQDYKGTYRQIHIVNPNHNRMLTFYLPHVESVLFGSPEILRDVWYKLGTGQRVADSNPPVFQGEKKDVAAFFHLKVPFDYGQKLVRMFWGCGLRNEPTSFFLPSLEKICQQSRQQDLEQYRLLQTTFPLPENLEFRTAILARIVGLTKFKTYIRLAGTQECVLVPHAGAWWFRTPWYRDVFEGLLNSFETLMALPEEKELVRKIILLALREQDEVSGRILNRIPEFRDLEQYYENSDGTLLCFVAANAYLQRTQDLDFALAVLPHIHKILTCFRKDNVKVGELFWKDGPPGVDGLTGLLLSVPHHSWIDTKSQWIKCDGQKIDELPSRVSKKFAQDLCRQMVDKERLRDLLYSPQFFLPEINAQWITMLRGTIQTIDFVLGQLSQPAHDAESLQSLKEATQDLLVRAEENYKRVFWNDQNGFLFNVVYADGTVKDEIECEAGVAAAAMLGTSVFTRSELASIWECARERLLVHRQLIEYGQDTWPFGIIARNEDRQVFYGDGQYHGDVVWLRSTPYLIKLLKLLDQEQTIRQILINTLDHQMTEGAIFYNQELLARPLGHNSSPDERTGQNPVPVKNPIQFWSQWCDAFVEFFAERSH